MDLKNIKEIVGNIKKHLFKNANSYSVGMLKSHFRGPGLQFKDHLPYSFGDDVRFIDWKVLAKTGHPYCRTFEEERNVEILIVLDITRSMFYGFNQKSKIFAALEICFLLILLVQKTNDKISLTIFADEIYELPLLKGEKGIFSLVKALGNIGVLDEKGEVNIFYQKKKNFGSKEMMTRIFGHLRKRKEIIVLSDLHSFLENNDLKKLFSYPSLHCFQILSPIDIEEKSKYPFFAENSSEPRLYSRVERGKSSLIKNMFEEGIQKKLKTLRLDRRYLEDFIKEML